MKLHQMILFLVVYCFVGFSSCYSAFIQPLFTKGKKALFSSYCLHFDILYGIIAVTSQYFPSFDQILMDEIAKKKKLAESPSNSKNHVHHVFSLHRPSEYEKKKWRSNGMKTVQHIYNLSKWHSENIVHLCGNCVHTNKTTTINSRKQKSEKSTPKKSCLRHLHSYSRKVYVHQATNAKDVMQNSTSGRYILQVFFSFSTKP